MLILRSKFHMPNNFSRYCLDPVWNCGAKHVTNFYRQRRSTTETQSLEYWTGTNNFGIPGGTNRRYQNNCQGDATCTKFLIGDCDSFLYRSRRCVEQQWELAYYIHCQFSRLPLVETYPGADDRTKEKKLKTNNHTHTHTQTHTMIKTHTHT